MMVKVILFKNKDQPGGNDDDVPVNVEFAPGTSVAQALETKSKLRRDAKKLKSAQGLTQLFVGDFEVKATTADTKYLQGEAVNKMLKRDYDGTQEDFRRVATFL